MTVTGRGCLAQSGSAAGRAVTTRRALARAVATAAAAAALLWAAPGRCEPPPLWSPPPLDPLRAASLPLRLADLIPPEPGCVRVEATVGYFNVQESSWHAPTLHGNLGLAGQPLSADELALLERAFPEDEIYLLDLEGWQVDLHASLGLGLAEIDFGLPVAFSYDFFTFEVEPGYVIPLYSSEGSSGTKGFLLLATLFFRIL